MITPSSLAIPAALHDRLKHHLFPGDGCEAAAILLCSRGVGPRVRLMARDVILIPHDACSRRTPISITWPGIYIEDALDLAEGDDLSVVLIHSHPGGYFDFSSTDDDSDQAVMPSLFSAFGNLHGTAVMMPDGAIKARTYGSDLNASAVDLVTVPGDDLLMWWGNRVWPQVRPMAFSGDMTAELGLLTAVVVGVSGTGSIGAEQAARLGFGHVILIDPDKVEKKNLNRILNSTIADASIARLKTEMFAEAIKGFRGDGVGKSVPLELGVREAVLEAAQADVIFSCVDSQEGRQIADFLAASFLLPLFDVGVTIPLRDAGTNKAIADVVGRIDYVQPGGSNLFDRGVWTPDGLRAEYLRKNSPEAFQSQLEEGYIKGIIETAPAVISLNMRAAAAMMNEFVARAYPFRHDSNRNFARTMFSLAAAEEEYLAEDDFPKRESYLVGQGAREPLLGIPLLAKEGNQ